jgi:hypothetical protein
VVSLRKFQEFTTACRDGTCEMLLDQTAALQWAQSGKYTTTALSAVVTCLTCVPCVVVVFFLVYALMSRSWLLLLALPVFAGAYVFFHPGWAFAGVLRSGPIFLSLIGFLWGVFNGLPGLVAITGVLSSIWLSHVLTYRTAVKTFTTAVKEHEDLLCLAWRHRKLAIRFRDGSTLFVDSQGRP